MQIFFFCILFGLSFSQEETTNPVTEESTGTTLASLLNLMDFNSTEHTAEHMAEHMAEHKIDRLVSAMQSIVDFSEFQKEVRRLERKVMQIAKALKKLNLYETDELEFDTTTTTTTTTTSTTTTTTTTTTDNGPCPDAWLYIGQSCYQIIVDSALPWEEARQQCMLMNSDLAEMNSIEEQQTFTNYISSWHYGVPLWLGGHMNKRGRWRWEWTETRIPMRSVKWGWATDYPRRLEAEGSCLSIRGRGEDAGLNVWEDMDCQERNNFVCEYLWLQEYADEENKDKLSKKLEENLVKVDQARKLSH